MASSESMRCPADSRPACAIADHPTYCAEVLDGKQIAADIRKEIAEEVTALREKTGKVRCARSGGFCDCPSGPV